MARLMAYILKERSSTSSEELGERQRKRGRQRRSVKQTKLSYNERFEYRTCGDGPRSGRNFVWHELGMYADNLTTVFTRLRGPLEKSLNDKIPVIILVGRTGVHDNGIQ